MKTIFEEYYEIRHKQDELAIKESSLKEKVLEELEKMPESAFNKSTYESAFGNFTKRITKKYLFSTNLIEYQAECESKIKELTKPLIEKIDELTLPFKKEIESRKQEDINSGNAKEDVSVSVAFSYLKK